MRRGIIAYARSLARKKIEAESEAERRSGGAGSPAGAGMSGERNEGNWKTNTVVIYKHD